jgi:hypothetical protein
MSCPFYGRVAVPTLQLLADRGTSNCALAAGPAFVPCQMHALGETPDWASCGENTGVEWKRNMAAWETDGQAEKKLFEFKYPD